MDLDLNCIYVQAVTQRPFKDMGTVTENQTKVHLAQYYFFAVDQQLIPSEEVKKISYCQLHTYIQYSNVFDA